MAGADRSAGTPVTTRTKVAQRVVDLLEFFDRAQPQVTVTDLVNRFGWPQSSTSELLVGLVDLGLLYKDPATRRFQLTPRAALLGGGQQPDMVRDGRLAGMIDALVEQTGLAVALYGFANLNVQIQYWRSGRQVLRTRDGRIASTGPGRRQERPSETAAGLLLLSTVDLARRDRLIRRLNAEAPDAAKFVAVDVAAQIVDCGLVGQATGASGFGLAADVSAILLPGFPPDQPVALGFVYQRDARIDAGRLCTALKDRVARLCAADVPVADAPDVSALRVDRHG